MRSLDLHNAVIEEADNTKIDEEDEELKKHPSGILFVFKPDEKDGSNGNVSKHFLKFKPQVDSKEEEKKDGDNWYDESKPVDEIDFDIETLDDLIRMGKLYDSDDFHTKNYNVNIAGVHAMIPVLQEFTELVGMKDLKQQAIEQIKYCSQNLHNRKPRKNNPKTDKIHRKPKLNNFLKLLTGQDEEEEDNENIYSMNSSMEHDEEDMFHTMILGPPGVGKTKVAKYFGRIYLYLGITTCDICILASRKDFVGLHVGHTAKKVHDLFEKAKGGVIIFDEGYSLANGRGSADKSDCFGKEAVDAIVFEMTQPGAAILILTGYMEFMKELLALNPGLESRFMFKYAIDGYTWKELTEILVKKINKKKWNVADKCEKWLYSSKFIEKYMGDNKFRYFGRSIEKLVIHTKIGHASRVYGKNAIFKQITQKDIENGYKRYIDYEITKNENKTKELLGMYS